MAAVSGSLLHAVVFAGLLLVVAFRPQRIASWGLYRAAAGLFAIAVALPALAAIAPADAARVDTWTLRFVSAASGVCTALSIFALLAACAGRGAGRPGSDA